MYKIIFLIGVDLSFEHSVSRFKIRMHFHAKQTFNRNKYKFSKNIKNIKRDFLMEIHRIYKKII